MRQRIISPSFWVDEGLVTVSPFARLLFVGLWGLSDREGRFECRPMRIKMLLFPCDDVDVSALLAELESIGVIVLYSVNGSGPLGYVVNFKKHQHPHHREASSILPSYDEKPRASLGLLPVEGGGSPTVTVSDTVKDTTVKSGSGRGSDDGSFEVFWTSYPRRVKRQSAEKSWDRLTKADREAALAVLPCWPFDLRDDKRFVPHPSTWINQRRWEDEIDSGSVLPDDD